MKIRFANTVQADVACGDAAPVGDAPVEETIDTIPHQNRIHPKDLKKDAAEMWRAGREARRKARLEAIAGISGVVSTSMERQARLIDAARGDTDFPRVNRNNIRGTALRTARNVIARHTQRELKLDYIGMRGDNSRSASSDIGDGIAVVHAELKTASGIRVPFDVPMRVLGGRLLDPSLILVNGAPRVVAPSTFRDIVSSNTSYQDVTFRGVFDLPKPGSVARDERRSRGMFASQQNADALRRAMRTRNADIEIEANPALLAGAGGGLAGAMGGGLGGELGAMALGQAVTNKVDDMTKEGDSDKESAVDKEGIAGVDEPEEGRFGIAESPGKEQWMIDPPPPGAPDYSKPGRPGFVPSWRKHPEVTFDPPPVDTGGLELDHKPYRAPPRRLAEKEQNVSDWTGEGNNPEEDDVMVGDRLELTDEIEIVQPGGHSWTYPEKTACTVLEKTASGYYVELEDGIETFVEPDMVRFAGFDEDDMPDSHEDRDETDCPSGVCPELGSQLDVMQKLTTLVNKLMQDGTTKKDIHQMLQSQYPELADKFVVIIGTDE